MHSTLSAKQRAFRALPLFVLAFLLFRPIGKSIDDLRRSIFRAFIENGRVLAAWQKPHSGEEEVMLPTVQDALALLRGHEVKVYSYSPDWVGADHFPPQRLVEGAFPILPMALPAPFYLGKVGGPIPEKCRLVDKKGEVFLAACH